MPIALDPMPGSMLVRFQSDLQHGFAFEIDGTGIEEGLRPTIELINRGVAALEYDQPEHRELIAKLVMTDRQRKMTDVDRYVAASMIQYLIDTGGVKPDANTCILPGVSPLRNMHPVGSA
jgi:hypothetical protein